MNPLLILKLIDLAFAAGQGIAEAIAAHNAVKAKLAAIGNRDPTPEEQAELSALSDTMLAEGDALAARGNGGTD